VVFISLVHKYLPKSLNEKSVSLTKIKAKHGANCFIFFAKDPSLFSALQIPLRPDCLQGALPNHDLNPDSSALAPWGVPKVLLAWIRPWGKTQKMQSPPAGKQAHPLLLKRWCFSCTENVLSPLLLSPSSPLKFLAVVGIIFQVHHRCFGACPSRAWLGRGHSSWL